MTNYNQSDAHFVSTTVLPLFDRLQTPRIKENYKKHDIELHKYFETHCKLLLLLLHELSLALDSLSLAEPNHWNCIYKSKQCALFGICKNKMPFWLKKQIKGALILVDIHDLLSFAKFPVVFLLVPYYLIKANFFQMSKTFCWTTQRAILMHWVWIYYLDIQLVCWL